jgi:hypothetical protein
MNQGFPGTYAQNGDCVISKCQIRSTDSAGPAFGKVVVSNFDAAGDFSDAAVSVAASVNPTMSQGVAGSFVGIAVREVMTQVATYSPAQPLTPLIQTYSPGLIADVIERGDVTVIVKDPQTAGYKRGQKVYLRIALNGTYPTAAVGDLETAADGGNTIQITNAFLSNGVVDGNSVTTITLLSRNTP